MQNEMTGSLTEHVHCLDGGRVTCAVLFPFRLLVSQIMPKLSMKKRDHRRSPPRRARFRRSGAWGGNRTRDSASGQTTIQNLRFLANLGLLAFFQFFCRTARPSLVAPMRIGNLPAPSLQNIRRKKGHPGPRCKMQKSFAPCIFLCRSPPAKTIGHGGSGTSSRSWG
jgi:hypothetical protein